MTSHQPSLIKTGSKHSLRLIVIIGLALFGFQLASVSHHHDSGHHAVIDNCLICSATGISSPGGALATSPQLLSLEHGAALQPAVAETQLHPRKSLAFRSRAPPVSV